MFESVPIQGIVTFRFTDARTGLPTRDPIVGNNLVTHAGKEYMIRKIIDDLSVVGSTISRIEFGEGSTAATGDDMGVEFPIVDIPIASKDSTNNVGEFISALSAGVGTGTISEVGLLTSDTPRILISRIVLSSPFTKDPNENVQVNWRIKIGSDPS